MHSPTHDEDTPPTYVSSATMQIRPLSGRNKGLQNERSLKSSPDSLCELTDNEKYVSAAVVGAEDEERQRKRANMLKWAKRLAIGVLCLLGVAFIIYIILTLSFSEWSKSKKSPRTPSASNRIVVGTPSSTTQSSESNSWLQPPAPFVELDAPNSQDTFQSKLGVYEHAAIATDKQVCSNIAGIILKQGGSVVDSAISALFCNGIVTMHGMGIGGGTLMNIYIRKERRAYAIDAYVVAPLTAYPQMFEDKKKDFVNGGDSIAVPGDLMGYHIAHQRFGKLPWKTLVEPAIKLCEDGFYLSRHMNMSLDIKNSRIKPQIVIPDIFNDPVTGKRYTVGTKVKPLKQYCKTLKMLAENGPLDFYNGTLAKLVLEDLREMGSPISSYDLKSYKSEIRSSTTMPFQNGTLFVMQPISSGTIVASILNSLEGYNLTKADWAGKKNQARTMHRLVEAFKFGYAKRGELGDSYFVDVREIVKFLTNPEYNMGIRARINDFSVYNNISDYDAKYVAIDDRGTSQMSIVAPNGDAVSLTTSLNDYFGCGFVGKRTGILFNDAMYDFAFDGRMNLDGLIATPTNYVEARKRPMSSMSPIILTDENGDVRLVIGAAGGSKIVAALVQVIARLLWLEQDPKEAVDEPRFYHQLLPNYITYEYNRFDEEVLTLLEKRGHQVKSFEGVGSVINVVLRKQNFLYAYSDNRRRGAPAGF